MARQYDRSSIYSNTKIKSFYLDIWEPKEIFPSTDDFFWVIEQKYHLRPDLAAYDIYGNEKLWYVFALRNKDILKDPLFDFTAGTEIIVPAKSSLSDI